MTYSNSYDSFENQRERSPSANQADLERIVRRALCANTGRSELARRILNEASDLAAAGLSRDSSQLVREIACRLSRAVTQAVAPRFAPTVLGTAGTVLV